MDISQYQASEQWANMVLDIWAEKISSLGISNAEQHANALAMEIVSGANGDADKIGFVFEYILKYTDMGVGRGVTFQNRGNINTSRVQKQWFTKTFLLEVKKLSNILAKHYAHEGTLYVKEIITDKS